MNDDENEHGELDLTAEEKNTMNFLCKAFDAQQVIVGEATYKGVTVKVICASVPKQLTPGMTEGTAAAPLALLLTEQMVNELTFSAGRRMTEDEGKTIRALAKAKVKERLMDVPTESQTKH